MPSTCPGYIFWYDMCPLLARTRPVFRTQWLIICLHHVCSHVAYSDNFINSQIALLTNHQSPPSPSPAIYCPSSITFGSQRISLIVGSVTFSLQTKIIKIFRIMDQLNCIKTIWYHHDTCTSLAPNCFMLQVDLHDFLCLVKGDTALFMSAWRVPAPSIAFALVFTPPTSSFSCHGGSSIRTLGLRATATAWSLAKSVLFTAEFMFIIWAWNW